MSATASEPRRIFPALLSDIEREMLERLSTESRLSISGVVRLVIVRETAGRLLVRQDPMTKGKAPK